MLWIGWMRAGSYDHSTIRCLHVHAGMGRFRTIIRIIADRQAAEHIRIFRAKSLMTFNVRLHRTTAPHAKKYGTIRHRGYIDSGCEFHAHHHKGEGNLSSVDTEIMSLRSRAWLRKTNLGAADASYSWSLLLLSRRSPDVLWCCTTRIGWKRYTRNARKNHENHRTQAE